MGDVVTTFPLTKHKDRRHTRPRPGPSGGGPAQLARADCGVDNGAVDVGAVANTVAIAVPPPAVAGAAVALTPLATAGAAHATTSAVGARPSPAASAAALKCSAVLVAAGATLVTADAKQLQLFGAAVPPTPPPPYPRPPPA